MNEHRLAWFETEAEFWQKMARLSHMDAVWNIARGNTAQAIRLQEMARRDAHRAMLNLDAAMILAHSA